MFDVARRLLLVDLDGDVEASRREVDIEETEWGVRVRRLGELGVEVLIAGAISRPLEAMLISTGMRVLSHTCGPTEEVLRAFILGRLPDDAFLMPGCCRRRFRGGGGMRRRVADARKDMT